MSLRNGLEKVSASLRNSLLRRMTDTFSSPLQRMTDPFSAPFSLTFSAWSANLELKWLGPFKYRLPRLQSPMCHHHLPLSRTEYYFWETVLTGMKQVSAKYVLHRMLNRESCISFGQRIKSTWNFFSYIWLYAQGGGKYAYIWQMTIFYLLSFSINKHSCTKWNQN